MTVHVYSSFSFAYLDRARVLYASLKRHCPDFRLWAVLIDEAPDGFEFDPAAEDFDHLLTAEDLYGDEAESFLFGHNIVEACTAVKGRALLHLMGQDDCDLVLYLDPDIAVFRPLDDLAETCARHAISLTPHQLTPDESDRAIRDNEVTSLHLGVFNLGFLGVSPSDEGWAFARWWTARLDALCVDRRHEGIFVDQKWCDLVPCFFEDVKILRDPGLNVASWNISRRDVRIHDDGAITVNGAPLGFWHFTKLGPVGDAMTQRYAGENTDIHEIWWWYRAEVLRNRDPAIPDAYWAYGTFEDGLPIPGNLRELYRSRPDARAEFPRPRAADNQSFRNWARLHGGLGA